MALPAHSVISIAEIVEQTSATVFYIEAGMVIADDLQKFYVLRVFGLPTEKKRTKHGRQFDCTKCQRTTTLVPRCSFEIELVDGTGSTTALISGNLAEKLLSMMADSIFHATYIQHQLLCINQAQQMLSNRLF